ncbi:MAG: PAS domain S-box protein [Phycisphaerae bacterium]|nr:PAS domain S-box protein [Phycisphaerae bacterium]
MKPTAPSAVAPSSSQSDDLVQSRRGSRSHTQFKPTDSVGGAIQPAGRGMQVHENTERLRAIVETAVDGIITIDSEGVVETMNPAAERMFGFTGDELIGRNITELMPEPYRSKHDSYLQRYLTTGERRIIGIGREVLGLRRDGSTFPMELAVSEMHLNGRRMFTGIVRDITERRAAEEKLRRLSALLDDSNDAIKLLDLSGNITAWNSGAERLYGYTESVALKMNIRELLPHDRSSEISEAIERLKRGERIPPFETNRVAANGHVLDIQCTLTLLKGRGGQPDTIVVTDRNITERKQHEAALRGSEAKTRAIVEAAVDAIITIDASGLIESANRAAERLFGYDAADLIGHNVSMLMPSPYREEHDCYIRRYLRTGVKKIIGLGREVYGRRRNGTTFPMELAISELRVDDRIMFTGIVRDISERKQFEQELTERTAVVAETNRILQEANSRAEEATAAKSAFLANMSHEIRTPMTAILGFAERLQDGELNEAERNSAIETIRRNGEHLLQIINDILDISKIEAGKMKVEHIRCSPIEIVQDVISLMKVRADAKGLALEVECAGAVPETIESDPTRLRQILVNLVGNAIKFTQKGSIRIECRLLENDEGPKMQFMVADTGIGMSPLEIERIFMPFSQADPSTTRKFGGTGLGLMVSHRFAQMLGGTITVDSKPEEGSRFCVVVSAGRLDGVRMAHDWHRTNLSAENVPTRPDADSEPLDCHILLAEDGMDNQRLIEHILTRSGATVQVVENGRMAIDAVMATLKASGRSAAERKFDLILLDMQMPEMDGYEAAINLRKIGFVNPIIALTAHAMSGDREKCLAAGCDEYATKPINRKALLNLIRSRIRK